VIQLVDFIEKTLLITPNEKNLILTGDFNEVPNSIPIKHLEKTLDNSWYICGDGGTKGE
jgi:hypothetical protein